MCVACLTLQKKGSFGSSKHNSWSLSKGCHFRWRPHGVNSYGLTRKIRENVFFSSLGLIIKLIGLGSATCSDFKLLTQFFRYINTEAKKSAHLRQKFQAYYFSCRNFSFIFWTQPSLRCVFFKFHLALVVE